MFSIVSVKCIKYVIIIYFSNFIPCVLSPRQGSGVKSHNPMDKKDYYNIPSQLMRDLILEYSRT